MPPPKTGIPKGTTIEAPRPAAPAAPFAEVKTEGGGAAMQAFCGVQYDELHLTTTKNIQTVQAQWPGKRSGHEVSLAKVETHPMCKDSSQLLAVKSLLDDAVEDFDEIMKAHNRSKSKEKATYPKRP